MRHRLQNHEAVARSHEWLGGAFGVWHQSHNIAAFVQNTGDVALGTVGIADVAQRDAIFGFERIESGLIGNITALAVSDWQPEDLAGTRFGSERRVQCFYSYGNRLSPELEAASGGQASGG